MLKFNDIAAAASVDPTAPQDIYADYVIEFTYTKAGPKSPAAAEYKNTVEKQYKQLISSLNRAGLRHESRPGSSGTILVFVLCPAETLKGQTNASRASDWLHGVRIATGSSDPQDLIDTKPQTPAERLRLVNELLTQPINDGGIGITPGSGEWTHVASIMPLHDRNFNRAWLKTWATSWLISDDQLTNIRNYFGEEIAYYFAFVQFYFLYLFAPTAVGVLVHYFSTAFSPIYSIAIVIWSIIFTEAWKRRELQLSILWGVRKVRNVEKKRAQFRGDSLRSDPITGEKVPYYAFWKRYLRMAEGLPFIFVGGILLALSITMVFTVEVFISELYAGPFNNVLVYLPTILFTTFIPRIAGAYTDVAKWLTERENHETQASHDFHLTQKIFVLSFLTSFMSLTVVSFVYIPFGDVIVPYLLTLVPGRIATKDVKFHVNAERLHKQFVYLTVTAQIINFVMETVVPYAMRTGVQEVDKIRERRHQEADARLGKEDEKQFLDRVKSEVSLPQYDIYGDYAEMASQFGNITLFGTIWPLAPLAALLNNWVELRSDAAKICINVRRPIPERTDTIGAWLDNITALSWLSSIYNAGLLALYSPVFAKLRGDIASAPAHPNSWERFIPGTGTAGGWGIGLLTLVMVLFSEHLYLALRAAIGTVMRHAPSWADDILKREQWETRKKLLGEQKTSTNSTASKIVGIYDQKSTGEFWTPETEQNDEGLQQLEKELGNA